MNAKMELERMPRSVARLKFHVPSTEVDGAYSKLLTKYTDQIQLPGFRRGKVPVSLIEKKFGEALQAEALQELIEEVLKENLPKAELKPLAYDRPRVIDEELNLKIGQDLSFTVEYDTFPQFTVPDYKGIEVIEPQVSIGDEDIAKELKVLQEQNGVVVNKTSGGAAEGDVLTLDFHELDVDGKVLPGSERQDFVMTLGKTENLYHFDRELTGMKAGEERTFTKEYPEDFGHKELAGSTKNLYVKLKVLKAMELPILDDDFAQDISEKFATLKDLKVDIQKSLEDKLADKVESLKVESLLDALILKTSIDLPESMVQIDLGQAWENLAQQNRVPPEQLDRIFGGPTKTKILDGWRPGAEQHLRRQLIMETIEEGLKFEVTPELEEKEITRLAAKFTITVEETREYYANKGMMENLKNDLRRKNTVNHLLSAVKVKKGPRQTFQELIDGPRQKSDNK